MEEENAKNLVNAELLYYISQGTFGKESQKFNPKDLDIDLQNLKHEGYIEENGSSYAITERGKKVLDILFAMTEELDTLSAPKEE